MNADIGKKLKIALGETRLLILGGQILMGFQLNGAFQDGFSKLPAISREVHACAFLSLVCAVGLLIAPSMQHRIVEGGHASVRILRVATRFADCALLPIALGLAADLYIAVGFRFGPSWGIVVGVAMGALAFFFWYAAAWLLRAGVRTKDEAAMTADGDTPLDERVENMLTEARVLIPGAQALFGFQLAIFLTETFGKLPEPSRFVHLGATCCIAVAVVLLMAPAAFHRISYRGSNTEGFLRLGSSLEIAAAVPLAIGIPADFYVAVAQAVGPQIAAAAAAAAAIILFVLWFAAPLVVRRTLRARSGR
jgi:hypothetical protein